jgi:hypothetical protein
VVVIKLKEIYNKIIEDIEPPKYTLYCDMDGVLADFENRFEQYSDGLTTDEYRDKFGINAFSILIDDRADTIREWDSQGGIGILHTSAANTIQQLKKLGL